jgi:hypothetical protein
MNRQRYTAAVIATSLIMGLAAGITLNSGIIEKKLEKDEVHGHALFFIEVNGTEIDLTEERFQIQDREVHLENNRSHIVHKHASGITWGQFLETVNISVNQRGDHTCLKMPENRYCGNSTVLLNGEDFRPGKEIQQGDKLAVIIGNRTQQKAEAYMDLSLPEAYQKTVPGTRI